MSKRIFLTTASVSPWTVPDDWNNSSNTIECIGGGGGTPIGGVGSGGGAGGGAYAKETNRPLVPGASIDFTVGVGGSAAGGDTFFNGLTLAASQVGAQGGQAPAGGAGGAGGSVGSSVGSIRFAGGAGGSNTGGGGGAAGKHGAGNAGLNGTGSSGTGGNGGSGDIAFGGAGGAGSGGGGGGNGVAGTEYDATHGSGGGGGGSATSTAGAGGTYGGGAGNGGDQGAAGGGGLIVITYEPIQEYLGGWNLNTNVPARFGKNFTAAGSGTQFAVASSSQAPLARGWTQHLEYRFGKRFPVTEQQFSANRIDKEPALVPDGVIGWQGDFGYKFRRRITPSDAQFFTNLSPTLPPTADGSFFWGYSAQNLVQLPTPADQLSFAVLPLFKLPSAPFPTGWNGDFGYAFKRPLSPALQQFIATRLDAAPPRASTLWGYSATDVVLLPFEACYQEFASVPFNTPPSPPIDQGWWGDFGWKFAKPFPVGDQQFQPDFSQGPVPTPETPQGWPGDIGVAHVKPLSAAQQQFSSTRIDPQPPPATPPGGFNVTPTYAFTKPLSAAQQQFSVVPRVNPPTAATPQGWQTNFDVKFAKRTPAALNPFLGFFVGGNVPSKVYPNGWAGYQPFLFARPFSAALQQYTAFQPWGLVPFVASTAIGVDPYIYPGDKKAEAEREKILGPYDPRKLSRKQRRLIAQLEAQRWEQLTAGPTREEKLHEDMQQAIQEVLEKAEKKRIEDAKVGGLFTAPPAVAIEASLHAAIRVVKELEAQQALDDARKAIARRKQEAIEQAEREASEALERADREARAARKAKKAAQDAKLLAKYRMKKRMEADEIHDAVFDVDRPRRSRSEREEILDAVIDIARRRK